MAEIVTMPKLGFDMAEGTLVRWVVNEGDTVAKGAVLAEIETDKATVEVESGYQGVVVRHLVKQGDIVPVNTPIAVVAEPGESVDFKALGLEAGEPAPAAPAPAKKDAPVVEDTPAAEPAAVQPATQPAAAQAGPVEVDGSLPGGVKASPLARRMAEEKGVDLRLVKGSGPGGRIVKADIESYQPVPAVSGAPAEALPAALSTPVPSLSFEKRQDEVVSLSRLRAAIGRRLVEAKQQIPHFYVTHEFDMDAAMVLRKQVNAMLPDEQRISVNDFIVRATALALRTFPNLNASIDLGKNQVVRHGQIHVGVAVAVENGLLTVVCKDTDQKPLRQIAVEVRSMAGRAREGKVRQDDIEGSTFSISNLGMFDVDEFIAIINPPEAAILAVGSVREVPVVKNGEIKIGMRMRATISVDHRVSDGAEAARFMQELAKYLEEPLRLLI